MKTSLVKVGNSRGIRIPKPLIEQCGLTDEVILEVREGSLVISAATSTRQGWETAFREMHAHVDDALLDQPPPTDWDDEEWEWK